jgi:serine/threonine protein kinase
MALAPGARLGPYEIIGPLGSGGMGDVYRARDARLKRDVAIKILPEAFASDPDRLARFRREAQVLASLNHPHIGHIYGFEDGAGHALILELVEGPTLADRLVQGPLSSAEALPIARQIADALEAAHEQGIIHRDLKPANIKVRDDGTVKVLDFGLAKALASASSIADASSDPMNSPTLTAYGTQMGVILGTAAYMSPEQAKGRVVDRRADIWAFGAVLYEMLSGQRAFRGEDTSDTLAAVLRQDVDWTALPADTPAAIRRLIRRCLDRNIKQRLRDIGEARIVLDDPGALDSPATTDRRDLSPKAPPLWRRALPVALGAIVAGSLVGMAWYVSLKPSAPVVVTRFSSSLPDGLQFTGISGRAVALSPDGTRIAYVANGRLHVRSMSELDSKPIQGTEGFQAVAEPVFSPDGRSIAFHVVYDQTLKKMAVTGGAPVTLTKADLPFGMSWGSDGIVFGQGSKGILRVGPNGGTAETLVSVKDGELAHGPQILPGGRHVLFTLATGTSPDRWNRAHIAVQSLTSGERRIVVEGGSDARYLPTGHLVYALGGRLLVVAFDLSRLEVTSDPVPMIDGVRRATGSGGANFTVSESGSLAYVPGPASGSGSDRLNLAFVDRNGGVEPLTLAAGAYTVPRVSPDGTRVAFGSDDDKEATIWIYSLSGASAAQRITFGGNNRFPTWSDDGRRIAFQSDRDGALGIYWQAADGTGAAERLTNPDPGTSHEPESWSPDGDILLFSVTKGSDVSLWTFSLKDRKAMPFRAVHSTTRTNATFSPDGRWVAYATTEQGETRTFVEPFPPTGARHQITPRLASQPLWAPDGKELFYNPRPGAIAVVTVTTTPTVAFGNPVEGSKPFQTGPPSVRRAFDMTPGGKFVGLLTAGQTDSATRNMNTQIQVVLNWFEELKQRVPAR